MASSECLSASNRSSRSCDAWEHPRCRRTCRSVTKIKAIAMDVDGVLTDGGVWWGPNGEEWKRFHFADIMGLSLARKSGMTDRSDVGREQPAGRSACQ